MHYPMILPHLSNLASGKMTPIVRVHGQRPSHHRNHMLKKWWHRGSLIRSLCSYSPQKSLKVINYDEDIYKATRFACWINRTHEVYPNHIEGLELNQETLALPLSVLSKLAGKARKRPLSILYLWYVLANILFREPGLE